MLAGVNGPSHGADKAVEEQETEGGAEIKDEIKDAGNLAEAEEDTATDTTTCWICVEPIKYYSVSDCEWFVFIR